MWNLLTSVLLANAVTIFGPAACPTPAQVQERLQLLLPGQVRDEQPGDLVNIAETESGDLELELHSGADGSVLRRQLPRRESCREQAAIVATVIAVWQVETQGPLPPLPAAALPPAATSKAPAPPPRAFQYELSAAFAASLAGAAFAPGGWLEGSILPRVHAHPVFVRFGLLGTGTREVAVGQGRALFTRPTARLGSGYRLQAGAWALDIGADFLLALLYVSGEGYSMNYAAIGVDTALGGGVRAGRHIGPLRLFADLSVVGWLRTTEVTVGGSLPASAQLPNAELLLSLGLTYFRRVPLSRHYFQNR